MFGGLIFAFTPFATTITEPYGGLAWVNECPATSVWGDQDANSDPWTSANVDDTEWTHDRPSIIPTRRCK